MILHVACLVAQVGNQLYDIRTISYWYKLIFGFFIVSALIINMSDFVKSVTNANEHFGSLKYHMVQPASCLIPSYPT